jgi:hypothetical protein
LENWEPGGSAWLDFENALESQTSWDKNVLAGTMMGFVSSKQFLST